MKIEAVIEIPQGSTWKFEKGGKYGLKLDRPLNQPIPYSYGYCPDTLENDGDPIDIFVLTDALIYPLTTVEVELIGVIKGIDNGKKDDKLLGVIVGDYEGFKTVGVGDVVRYLETYKTGFEVLGLGNKDDAEKIYKESLDLYKEHRSVQKAYIEQKLYGQKLSSD